MSPLRQEARRNGLRLTARSAVGLTAAIGVILSLAACGSSSNPGSGASTTGTASKVGAGKMIALSLNGNVEYNKNLATGMFQALKGAAYSTKIVQSNFDNNTELSNLQSLLAQGIKGLVINPNTVQDALSSIKQAHSMGIPVGLATWSAATPLDQYLTTIVDIDTVAMGKEIGDYVKAHAKPGPVIVVEGVLGQGYSEGLDQGVEQSLAGSGFSIVLKQQGFFDRNKGIGVVQAGLQAHPNTTAIIDYSTVMGDGIASYLKNNGYKNIIHVSTVVDAEALQWLGTPYMSAVDYYSPAETGLLAAQGVREALEGKTPQKMVKVFHSIATKATIDQILKAHPYQYPSFLGNVNMS